MLFKWTYELSGNNYRGATLSKSYLTSKHVKVTNGHSAPCYCIFKTKQTLGSNVGNGLFN